MSAARDRTLVELATLVLHGREGDPARDAAIALLGVAKLDTDQILARQRVLAAAVAEAPGDEERWAELLASLAASGRAKETLEGLTHAAERRLPARLWHVALGMAAASGQVTLSVAIAEHGTTHHPMDPELWSTVAVARVGARDLDGARIATQRALALNDGVAAPWIAEAHLAVAERDRDRAIRAVARARAFGADPALCDALAAAAE